ncbi:hypothetical protein DERF_012325 [Dermatophagoides farinae]|uniref:Uncharacterized protein n=1 Tax=Dermatophagoides farinae TaxID=6954 RepID=A0A922HPD2_DERFA|nr:hypothetical protein DERF_012325 [Dermatophagoides farinae]
MKILLNFSIGIVMIFWRGQNDWQLDNWENHIKVYATQAIIKSSPRCFSSPIMAKSQIDNIDIYLFQDDFKNIDQQFLQSVVSIFSFFNFKKSFRKQFLLMTKDATYAYGEEICSSFSLKHDMSKPQRISLLNDVKIVQVDYGRNFIAILTDDGQVFLASAPKTKWKTKRTLQLISNDNDRFKMIACGCLHLLLLRQDGHVFAMGNNCFGQITGNERLSYETCGGDHSLSITNKGEIYSWGLNSCGQLGLG